MHTLSARYEIVPDMAAGAAANITVGDVTITVQLWAEERAEMEELVDRIVHCVNSHTALVEALEKILDGDTMHGNQGFTHADVLQEHYKIARRALTLARKEPEL